MRKPFYLYGALCVTAIGMLALALPAQADNVKKSTLPNPNTKTSRHLNKDNRAAPPPSPQHNKSGNQPRSNTAKHQESERRLGCDL